MAGGFPLRSVGSKPKLGYPAYNTRSRKVKQITSSSKVSVKSSKVSVQGETVGDTESLLKGQHKKFCLQPLSLGSARGRAEWTRDT